MQIENEIHLLDPIRHEEHKQYKIFLSTEAGGSGLNLQVADTVINFELPWNPAKKNQRIGRIDRLGQKSNNLSIFNLNFEIFDRGTDCLGLLVKQRLFDGVLGDGAQTHFVDFSSKGRSQFIHQLEEFISETESMDTHIKRDQLQKVDKAAEEFTETSHLDLLSDDLDDIREEEFEDSQKLEVLDTAKVEELEVVMNSGMQFLSGLFKMTTGKEMLPEGQHIDVNKETGEATMKFKLPGW